VALRLHYRGGHAKGHVGAFFFILQVSTNVEGGVWVTPRMASVDDDSIEGLITVELYRQKFSWLPKLPSKISGCVCRRASLFGLPLCFGTPRSDLLPLHFDFKRSPSPPRVDLSRESVKLELIMPTGCDPKNHRKREAVSKRETPEDESLSALVEEIKDEKDE